MNNLLTAILLLAGAMLALSCGSTSQQNEYADLLRRARDLEQRHCQVKAGIDSLWDITTTRLESGLPADFPAVDRDIFLKARNADHIKMFMSFKKLDPNIQAIVNDAGKYDALLAVQVHLLMEQKQEFDRQKIQFLRKVEQQDQATGRLYANEFRTAAMDVCR